MTEIIFIGYFNPNEIPSETVDKVLDLCFLSLNCHFLKFIKNRLHQITSKTVTPAENTTLITINFFYLVVRKSNHKLN